MQIKGLIDQLKVKALSSGDQEKLTAAEDNGLAQILADVLGGEDAPTQVWGLLWSDLMLLQGSHAAECPCCNEHAVCMHL